ncbi:NucA/NucB deoxyribonuclease domain-containing protein [Streptomyces sp. FH025]|uniref:NucA/NucB deoxyribonuclease domain-containing protein n=1 Tax=Streptomyces sp. FH025 TaxID=2815937 RepID=UPI001A9CDF61|nr:NucA/NucB deoxyribonuclease domain-containing protein [Streptomyces sp. FH025]MBO1417408.1 hypothetical protein [Streptomyces sp. FH025]
MITFTSSTPLPSIPIGTPVDQAIEKIAALGGIESATGAASTSLPRPPVPSLEETESKRRSQFYGSQAGEFTPQNPRSILGIVDFEACRNNPNGAAENGVVIDHFNFCRHRYTGAIHYENGKVKGTLDYRETQVGSGSRGNREALISAELTEFKMAGSFNQSSNLTVYMGTNAKQGQTACRAAGATNPITNTVAKWMGNGFIGWSILSDEAQGTGDEKIVDCMWLLYQRAAPSGENWTNWYGAPYQDLRFDSASYLPSKLGVIFSRVTPVMQYSRTDPLVKGVAEHIYTAFTNPNSTLPATSNGAKVIPGNIKSTPPSLITRLYPGANPIADQAYKDNRAVVSAACSSLPHNPGEECDEFPFASTWEGAGRGDGNFSVRYVDGTQNGNAGTALAVWYGSDRILHNDKFGVSILP